ncbi:MAG TPA: 3-methyl-2-oxobutanoate hydroxymethyltransferase [Gemmatimonadaceae bacterium]|nr:3-methyl-2-oxobutanoate hydroxymethyltransferase [Gemmatimonadaceae bacterium]
MSGAVPEAKRVTARDFARKKAAGERIVVVAAYDALFARLSEEGGVDAVLVGDSLGNVIAGHDSTLPVTLEQMIYHGAAARRGLRRAMLIVDMPFLSYQTGSDDAVRNCGRVVQETGAQALKLEGAGPRVEGAIRAVVELGVPVMGHLGFTPQSVHTLGTRVQGREPAAADALVDAARRLEDAGVFSIVLELVPAALAERVREAVAVPTIGIGAGASCDGQVLVLHDLLGFTEGFSPRFLKRYASLADQTRDAVRRFADEVRDGTFPAAEHSF